MLFTACTSQTKPKQASKPIEFQDEQTKQLCIQNWDTNKDGKLSYDEAATVTELGNVFKGSAISSFDELELFTGLTWIGDYTFAGCASLTSIAIPDSVTSIGDGAFAGCKSLTSITIPNNTTFIGGGAFAGCTSLTSVTVPDSVTEFGVEIFNECASLKDTYVNVTDLVAYATINSSSVFPGNKHLLVNGKEITELVIPDSVTEIGDYTFAGCTSLTSVIIPASITSIGELAFDDCTSLNDTYVNITDLAAYATSNNMCRLPGNKHLLVNGKEITELVIPDSVTKIGIDAFSSCTSLTSITIPDSVTKIGNSAFWHCISLTSVTIGNGVTEIGLGAFEDCTSLTSVTIPDSVKIIAGGAFYGCTSLTSITIPNSVTGIGNSAFQNCKSLTSVYCKATTPPTGYKSMFDNNASDRKIYVPHNSVSAYKSAKNWRNYAKYIEGYDF